VTLLRLDGGVELLRHLHPLGLGTRRGRRRRVRIRRAFAAEPCICLKAWIWRRACAPPHN
jgi:hypothetical protein